MTKTVLSIRPLPIDGSMIYALKVAGVDLMHLPTLHVSIFVDEAFERRITRNGLDYNGAVFVSQHAVAFAAERLSVLNCSWSSEVWMAAVGHASGRAIIKTWPEAQIVMPGVTQTEDSEGLWLALNQKKLVAVGGKVLIVRAQTGRDVLCQRLQDAGVSVDVWSCYHRSPQTWSELDCKKVLEKLESGGLVLFVTSIEGVISLIDNCSEFLEQLLSQPLVTFHHSIEEKAKLLGFTNVTCVALNKTIEALVDLSKALQFNSSIY